MDFGPYDLVVGIHPTEQACTNHIIGINLFNPKWPLEEWSYSCVPFIPPIGEDT
jgi:hypothetical protein